MNVLFCLKNSCSFNKLNTIELEWGKFSIVVLKIAIHSKTYRQFFLCELFLSKIFLNILIEYFLMCSLFQYFQFSTFIFVGSRYLSCSLFLWTLTLLDYILDYISFFISIRVLINIGGSTYANVFVSLIFIYRSYTSSQYLYLIADPSNISYH